MVQGRIIKRLLRQPAGEHSSDGNLGFEMRIDRSVLRPSTSQSAAYAIGSSLTCLDQSPSGSIAIVAGERTFKTLRVEGSKITEGFDLRASISPQPTGQSDTVAALNDQLNIKTLKWAHGQLDNVVVAASLNGRITLYDLNRLNGGLDIGRIHDHTRQVHKLAFNPWKPAWLLTAGQDGTVKLFDIYSSDTGRTGQLFKTKSTFKGNADGIRDVKWSPEDGFCFACSTASGVVQYWDCRKNVAPLLKFNAHDSLCTSISWHPDGKHLISGGNDHWCHVWDLSSSAERRQKPKYSFSTPAPVSMISWRPACWSTSMNARRAAQVVVAYGEAPIGRSSMSGVHLWDLSRPSLPFKEFTNVGSSPSGMVWNERDLLWTVIKEGIFAQSDVAFAPKIIDQRSLSSFDFSASGDLVMLLEERQGRPRSVSPVFFEGPATVHDASNHGSQSPKGGRLSMSKSDSDEDVVGAFSRAGAGGAEEGCGSQAPKLKARRSSTRSTSSLSATPPSFHGSLDMDLMDLDEAVNVTGQYKSQQIMAVGPAPSALDRISLEFLANRYLQRIANDQIYSKQTKASRQTLTDRITNTLDYFARCSEKIGQFRMAQTWKIFAYTIGILLSRRADHHRAVRLERAKNKIARLNESTMRDGQVSRHDAETTMEDTSPVRHLQDLPVQPALKSLLSDELESTSNMTTPQARPMRDSAVFETTASIKMGLIDHDELTLDQAVHMKSPKSPPVPEVPSPVSQSSSYDGYDFYDLGSIATPAIDIAARPPRKAPLRLDLDTNRAGFGQTGTSLTRQDSAGSFQMFSTSNESNTAQFLGTSKSFEQLDKTQKRQQPTSDIESSWDSSETSDDKPFRQVDTKDDTNLQSAIIKDGNATGPPLKSRERSVPSDVQTQEQGLHDACLADSAATVLPEMDENSSELLDFDHFPQAHDPPFLPSPIDPHRLVEATLRFEAFRGCVTAAIMVILLRPLLLPSTLDDTQSASILHQFHSRLASMMLFYEAALLRNLAYPLYRSTYSQGLHNITIGYSCTACGQALDVAKVERGQSLQQCRKCKTRLTVCAVCQEEDLESRWRTDLEAAAGPDGALRDAAIWWWCQGCGHGGHGPCLRAWHTIEGSSADEGMCPVDGCLHPCLPGTWRDELRLERKAKKNEEVNKQVKESKRSIRGDVVRRDSRDAAESKAVESVRGALSAGTIGLERKKSVKVVAPGEE